MESRVARRTHRANMHAANALCGAADALDALVLMPAQLLAAVCERAAPHLALRNAVHWKRLAGQSRTVLWSERGATAASRRLACERAWTSAADFLEYGAPRASDGDTATSCVHDARLGLWAILHVESYRRLGVGDRLLLDELLRQMLIWHRPSRAAEGRAR